MAIFGIGKKQTGAGRPRSFKGPVAWLLGRQLVAGLKWIAIYGLYGDKLDPRDWMSAEPDHRHADKAEDGVFWFDYMADSGDGQKAVYNIAYLCQSDLWLDNENLEPGPDKIYLDQGEGYSQLPRGQFLFVGGDTAYHIADYATLEERFRRPFNWAHDDIHSTGRSVERRPIYGIPGNHDYYDALDGFNRQFRQSITEGCGCDDDTDPRQPPLDLKGFTRGQTASYVALKLPFNWWFWGMDTQYGIIDRRQQDFFLSTYGKQLYRDDAYHQLEPDLHDKLIVATPEPSTTFGKWAGHDGNIVKTFESLGLDPSFLQSKDGRLSKRKCRLDISGDVHHYARYWGEPEGGTTNYASVVAGGGGAFLHPTHTDVEEVSEARIYPSPKESHRLMTRRLLNPTNIFLGGYVWLAGAVLAALAYFGFTIPESTWSLFKLVGHEMRPCGTETGCGADTLLGRIQMAMDIRPFIGTYAETLTKPLAYFSLDIAYVIALIVFLIDWLRRIPDRFNYEVLYGEQRKWRQLVRGFLWPLVAAFSPFILFILSKRAPVPHSFLASLLIALFLAVAIIAVVISRRYSDRLVERGKYCGESKWDLLPIWVLLGLAAISAGYGFLRYGTFPASIMTFDLIFALVLSALIVGLTVMAALVGGKLLDAKGKGWFSLLGFWHAILQLCVPLLLVLYASWTHIAWTIVGVWLVTEAARWLFSGNWAAGEDGSLPNQGKLARLLLAAWVVLGAVTLVTAGWGEPVEVSWSRILAAPALGTFFSCIWFGWYLTVALAFNGHNNEAGGGARAEAYRHFVRFRLTPNSLTGYVIGVDQPSADLTKGNRGFRLVDVFTIHCGVDS